MPATAGDDLGSRDSATQPSGPWRIIRNRRAAMIAAVLAIAVPTLASAESSEEPLQYFLELDKLEYRGGTNDSVAWEVDAWAGRELRKIWLVLEGNKDPQSTSADMKLLYTRKISQHWNIQVGVKHDFSPGPSQDWIALIFHGVGLSGFHIEGQFYVADSGQAAFEYEMSSNYRIAPKWLLHPKLEFDYTSQTSVQHLLGSGVNDIKLSAKFLYQYRENFEPYVGVYYEKLFGQTAEINEANGSDDYEFQFILGIRAWF